MATGTILLTLDGSDFAGRAIDHAERLATALDERIVLLDVLPDHRGPEPFSIAGARMSERHDALVHLEEARSRLLAGGVREVEIMRVEDNSAAEAITDTAVQLDCDAVVMATHSRGRLARIFKGSIADQVVRQLKGVPVLLIPPSAA
ncbi:MAG: universal stress protein [Dehalococcoidia bacterium]|jgi:universal stress protein A|nr:universal stress protein [Dehalococcoidia bacterium]